MESLGEVLKMFPAGRAVNANAGRLMADLLADPYVKELRGEHPDLNEAMIRLNMNKVYQFAKERRNCANCPGLESCPNDFEGYYTKLECETVNGELQLFDRKSACRLETARQAQESIRRKIRSFYIDSAALSREYSVAEIMALDAKRAVAVDQILDYIERTVDQGLPQKGLYLAGHFGTGKTFLMCYMLQAMAKLGYSGVIVYMPEFVEDLKSMFGEPGRLKETVELMKETDLLVFDDIGAENLNPWVRDHVLGTILNYRMNRKPTFYTSNHDLNALERHFSFTSKDGDELHKGQRLMDRIRPYVTTVIVNGENKRGRVE